MNCCRLDQWPCLPSRKWIVVLKGEGFLNIVQFSEILNAGPRSVTPAICVLWGFEYQSPVPWGQVIFDDSSLSFSFFLSTQHSVNLQPATGKRSHHSV